MKFVIIPSNAKKPALFLINTDRKRMHFIIFLMLFKYTIYDIFLRFILTCKSHYSIDLFIFEIKEFILIAPKNNRNTLVVNIFNIIFSFFFPFFNNIQYFIAQYYFIFNVIAIILFILPKAFIILCTDILTFHILSVACKFVLSKGLL